MLAYLSVKLRRIEKGLLMKTLMKTTTVTLAVAVAVSSWFSAADGAYHRKKGVRHSVARSTVKPAPPARDRSNCQSIRGMSSDNIYGVDNDVNVYRDNKVRCN